MAGSLWHRECAPLDGTDRVPPERAGVVVIGGGLAGISTALHLVDLGVDVVLLEADRVASRASGRGVGQSWVGLGEHYHHVAERLGHDNARLLWAFSRDNRAALREALVGCHVACDLVEGGGLRMAATAVESGELAASAALLRSEGRACRLLPRDALQAVFPAAEGYHGALELPDDATLQPVALVRGLARAASSLGVRVCENRRVQRIDGDAGDFRVVLADGASLRAKTVVHCTAALARELDHTGFLLRNVLPYRGQVLATDPLPDHVVTRIPDRAMSSDSFQVCFRLHRRRFVIGGHLGRVQGEQPGLLDDCANDPDLTRELCSHVDRHLPILRGLPFPHAWSGILAGTRDGLPLCGALSDQPGVFALLAFHGDGLGLGFLAGRCLAEQVVHGRATHPAAGLFAPQRFQG